MERYKLILAYDGTDFHGFQYQVDYRTVQNVVEDALHKLNWSGKSVLFAGRTDAGVHAAGQVLAFDLEWNHSLIQLRNALNALLPRDVAVKEITTCSLDFHPRYDAQSRTYWYSIYCEPVRNPSFERYTWRVWPIPDLKRLIAISQFFVGVHDFSGFGQATSPDGSTIRQVYSAEWKKKDGILRFQITGNAFLYHMVRRIVHIQIMVGQSNLDQNILLTALDSPPKEPLQGLAPPQGLSLVEVTYAAEE
jgi:tRNA pseudouridine38-40 synthase